MKRYAVCTLTFGELYEKLARTSHETISAYAEKCGADFVVEREQTTANPCYAKFGLVRRLLQKYKRVLYVDTDVLIRFDAPNLFDMYTPVVVAAFDEGDMFPDRRQAKKLLCEQIGITPPKAWLESSLYFNAGVYLVSAMHLPLFEECPEEYDNFGEQTLWNYRVFASGFKTARLPYRFNRLPFTLRLTGEQFDDSYFAHFAGAFSASGSPIEENLATWLRLANRFKLYKARGSVPKFRRLIYIETAAALGDVVSMEPVVRYVREQIEPDADIVIKTLFPDVFAHLKGEFTKILGPKETAPDHGHLRIYLTPEAKFANFNFMPAVDYGAVAAFGGHVPDAHRRVKLKAAERAPANLEDYVLVHPGKSWQSKTFPRAWWNDVIDGLLAKGQNVALIGKTYPKDDFRGTVDVDGFGCLDLRNKTTLPELFACIRDAKALVSNDSSPIHIAGAFENPAIMITSAKQADFIWPDRPGGLNVTLGRPIKAGFPTIGAVNNSYMDTCDEAELLSVLPPAKLVVETVLHAISVNALERGNRARNRKDVSTGSASLRGVTQDANRG